MLWLVLAAALGVSAVLAIGAALIARDPAQYEGRHLAVVPDPEPDPGPDFFGSMGLADDPAPVGRWSGLVAGQSDAAMRDTLAGVSAGLRERYGELDDEYPPPWPRLEGDWLPAPPVGWKFAQYEPDWRERTMAELAPEALDSGPGGSPPFPPGPAPDGAGAADEPPSPPPADDDWLARQLAGHDRWAARMAALA